MAETVIKGSKKILTCTAILHPRQQAVRQADCQTGPTYFRRGRISTEVFWRFEKPQKQSWDLVLKSPRCR